MIAHSLAGISLLVAVSINPSVIAPGDAGAWAQMTTQEKNAGMRPLVQTATECVARAVAADPRLGQTKVTDLIVDSFKFCGDPVRALIDAHDRFYGSGTGEVFFMGPYLDALPAAITGIVGRHAR